MTKSIQALTGMNDILPSQTQVWQFVEGKVRHLFSSYGYGEIRTPLVESTHLFARSIGEVTDVVEKEMYTFTDRNDESISLRPEGTAGVVRALEQHQLGAFMRRGVKEPVQQAQRMWYTGPMFRYEKPQKGRYRQFHQFGVECFGMQGPDIDAEIIIMTARLWKELGIESGVQLQLNTLGSNEARAEYKNALVAYLSQHKDRLDEDSQRRLESNPLRILDSKDEATQAVLDGAPSFYDYLDEESELHFEQLKAILDAANIEYIVNPKLVRGLDYYSKTVFEWVTDQLGAQGTVCGGGRYDGLVEQLGGYATPAIGFGMGVERLILLLETMDVIPDAVRKQIDLAIVPVGDKTATTGLLLAEQIRHTLSTLRVQVICGGGSQKSLLKKATASGADYAITLKQDENGTDNFTLMGAAKDYAPQSVSTDELIALLQDIYQ